MSELPQGLDRGRHAELRARVFEPWARRAFLALLATALIAALAGLAGQQARTSRAAGPAARLELRMPEVVRGGLLFQARIRIAALRTIEHPRLVLDAGYREGLQINTIAPGPATETSRGDRFVLSYDQTIERGRTFTVYMQFQVDPTSVGKSSTAIELADGTAPLARIDRTLRRLP